MPCSVNPGQEPPVERTSDAVRSGVGGFCEMPGCHIDPLTVEKALEWLDKCEGSRNREWRRFMVLRDAAEQAMKFGELGALGDVLHALNDPRWLPSSGAEPEADVIERESESGAGSQNIVLGNTPKIQPSQKP